MFVVLVYPLKLLASWVKDAVLLPLLAVHLLLRNAVPPSQLAVLLLPRPAVLPHRRPAVLLHQRLAVHLLLRPAVPQLQNLAATPAKAAAADTRNCSTVASCGVAKIVAVKCSTVAKIVAAKSKFVAAKLRSLAVLQLQPAVHQLLSRLAVLRHPSLAATNQI